MRIYIYIIWFPSKKSYVGQTYNLKGRMLSHLGAGSLVGNALRKYDDWKVSILHTVKIRDEANRIEIEEIRNFNSVCPNGYNLTRGGEGGLGCQISEETRKKISEAKKGHQVSEKTKKKLSEAQKGNKNLLGYKRSKINILKQQITVLRRKLDG